MSCTDIVTKDATPEQNCRCYKAVMKACTALIKAGRPDVCVLQTARIIYHYHHPEASKEDASLTVERWVYAGRFH